MSKFAFPLRLAPLCAALLLGGCMSLAPNYHRPAAPVPDRFGDSVATDPKAPSADSLGWQKFFQDARLKALVALALDNNRDLRVAVLSIEQARAQVGLRRADLLPTVGVGITGNRGPDASGAIASLYTAGLAVNAYELDFFGRLRSLKDSAQAQLLATEEARKTVQMTLVAGVANAYLNLLADDELLRLTQDTVASRQESLKLTRLKFDSDAASKIDLSAALSLLEAANVAQAQLTRQRAQDVNALTLLLGQTIPANLPAGLPLGSQGLVADLPAGVPSELLVRRPDVVQAEQQLRAYNANIGAARAAYFPQITLTGSVGVASTDLSKLFNAGTSAWTFVPQLLLPIFDFGRHGANLDNATAARDIAVAQYEKSIQSAFRDVADALAGRATLTEQLRAQTAEQDAQKTLTSLTELRFKVGAASSLDLLDAKRALFVAQQAVIQVQLQQVQNLVTLYKTLGGGWN